MRTTARVYRSYEEFEREELRSSEKLDTTIDDMLDELFREEQDFDAPGRGRRNADDE